MKYPAGAPFDGKRLLIAVSRAREAELLSELLAHGDLVPGGRALNATMLGSLAARGEADVILVDAALPGIAVGGRCPALERLARGGASARPPIVVLHPSPELWRELLPGTRVVRADTPPEELRAVLLAAASGAPPAVAPPTEPAERRTAARPLPAVRPSGSVVLAAAGSAGCTTVAVSLVAALAARGEPAVLVELAPQRPAAAAMLDLAIDRGLLNVARARPETPDDWDAVLARELQYVGEGRLEALVLAGLPLPAHAPLLTPALADGLATHLARRYPWVLFDVGEELAYGAPGSEALGAAAAFADRVLLVAGTHVPALHRAVRTLDALETLAAVGRARVDLVLSGHDPRLDERPLAISAALGFPHGPSAVIPHDHGAARAALAARRPLACSARSAMRFRRLGRRRDAAEALHGLADRLIGARGERSTPEAQEDAPRASGAADGVVRTAAADPAAGGA